MSVDWLDDIKGVFNVYGYVDGKLKEIVKDVQSEDEVKKIARQLHEEGYEVRVKMWRVS
jgi:hypothetical protein